MHISFSYLTFFSRLNYRLIDDRIKYLTGQCGAQIETLSKLLARGLAHGKHPKMSPRFEA